MTKVFLTWLGKNDLLPDKHNIHNALKETNYDEVHLLGNTNDQDKHRVPYYAQKDNLYDEYVEIRKEFDQAKNKETSFYFPYSEKSYNLFKTRLVKDSNHGSVHLHTRNLKSPTCYDSVYRFIKDVIQGILKDKQKPSVEFTFHVSSGTGTVISMLVILSKTLYPARLIETRFPQYLEEEQPDRLFASEVKIPFELGIDLSKIGDGRISQALAEPLGFEDIVTESSTMKAVYAKVLKYAKTNLPILLTGETGTGKTDIAKKIHFHSRPNGPFVEINCGAIAKDLIESELFGHEKGSFSGAIKETNGKFEQAINGTLFLDEVGELPLLQQVKILKVLDGSCFQKVGGTKTVDLKGRVRIIAATNKDLWEEIKEGRFREDLLYRLNILPLHVPPLRERLEDLQILVDQVMQKLCNTDTVLKSLSGDAMSLLRSYDWPGNVRELQNTIARAMYLSEDSLINCKDIKDSITQRPARFYKDTAHGILDRPMTKEPDFLDEILNEVSRHYIERAIKESNGVKTKAAELLGLKSYQTLDQRRKRLGM